MRIYMKQTNSQEESCPMICTNTLIRSYNAVLPFYSMMENLLNNINPSKEEKNVQKIKQLYLNLIKKNYVFCKVGIFYVEKYIFASCYSSLFNYSDSDKNLFINNKIILYGWIEPEMLEIDINSTSKELEVKNLFEIYETFYNGIHENEIKLQLLKKYKTPTMKICILLQIIANIYVMTGRNANHDAIFPILVYSILKAQVKDIYLHLEFIRKYRSEIEVTCNETCNHLINVKNNDICSCFPTNLENTSEIEYYLTIFDAAILYVERIEYADLKVEQCVFDRNICQGIDKLQKIELQPLKDKKEQKLYQKAKNKIKNIFKSLYK